jgi:PRC-barrel domain
MLQSINEIYGKKLAALDGDIGHVKDFYFDDDAWAVRYVVVDTGTWLTGRLVLLSPHAFEKLDQHEKTLRVNLRKKQIQDSPSIATHETVSRQFEENYYRSYGWPAYWQGGQMWGMSGDPLVASPQPRDVAVRQSLEPSADRHLESTKAVTGYAVEAPDGTIGHVRDFHVDATNWAVDEIAVEAGHWYSGRQILLSPGQIDRIDFQEKKVFVKLTKADIGRA